MAASTKLSVIAVFCLALSVYARSSTPVDMSACSKKEDAICAKPDRKEMCYHPVVQMQCPRLCGACAPFTTTCPSNYPFGCCWDGSESLELDKSDCKECVDQSPNICRRHEANCDLHPETRQWRLLCPVTCGACGDYGN